MLFRSRAFFRLCLSHLWGHASGPLQYPVEGSKTFCRTPHSRWRRLFSGHRSPFVVPIDSPLFTLYLVAVVFLLSFLMISAIRYPSLSQLNLGRGKSHLNVLLIALLVAGVAWYSQEVLMVLATLYLSTGLFSRAHQFVRYRLRSEQFAPKEPRID